VAREPSIRPGNLRSGRHEDPKENHHCPRQEGTVAEKEIQVPKMDWSDYVVPHPPAPVTRPQGISTVAAAEGIRRVAHAAAAAAPAPTRTFPPRPPEPLTFNLCNP